MQVTMGDVSRRVVIVGAAASLAVLSTMSFLAGGSFGDDFAGNGDLDVGDVSLVYDEPTAAVREAAPAPPLSDASTIGGTTRTGGDSTTSIDGSRRRGPGGSGDEPGTDGTTPGGGPGSTVNETVDGVTNDLGEAVGGVTDTVDDTVEDIAGGEVGGAVDEVTDTVDDSVGDVTGAVDDVTDEVGDAVDDLVDVLP